MKLEGASEENILTLLCWDVKHASAAALVLTADLFSTRAYRRIAECALNHLAEHKEPPRHHLRDILELQLRKGEEGLLLDKILEQMEILSTALQPSYVLTTLDRFIRMRKLTIALERSSDELANGDLEAAQNAIYSQDIGVRQLSPGIWLSDSERMLSFLDNHDDDFFSSGIQALDDRGCRPARKAMWCLVAPPKRGKSWHLIEIGKAALLHGHKVLHITLENSEEITAKRYVQSLFAMTQGQASMIRTPMFVRKDNGRVEIVHEDFMPESLMTTPRRQIANKLKQLKSKAPFLIKEFPTSTLTIQMLNAYLDMLARVEGFEPDLLIVDYPDLMAVDSGNLRIDLGVLFKQLRGVAVTRNMALAVVTQGGRDAAKARLVTETMVAEDFSKVMTSDALVTYSQTADERRHNLARVYVAAARNAADKYIVVMSQSYTTGQFCLDSEFFSHHMETEVERVTGEGEEQDQE